MKKTHYSFLVLLTVFVLTSVTFVSSKPKQLFEKVIFVELNYPEDSMLFTPHSKAWQTVWKANADLFAKNGTALMNSEKYIRSFQDRRDNLWTILHPMIVNGTIQSYFPYDPEMSGYGAWDDGELRYQAAGQNENKTFLTSEEARNNLSYLLGQYGPESDLPLFTEFGEDSIKTMEDGTLVFVYPPPDYYWYEDNDILKYKLRVSVLFNKKGKEKKRVIQALAPVKRTIQDGVSVGEEELLWVDFEEIESTLKEAYYFDENSKPVSYLKHLLSKVENATVPK
ncbi:MAG: hypothetical protein AB8B56_21160 [Crocinitomicaceae bacterium]